MENNPETMYSYTLGHINLSADPKDIILKNSIPNSINISEFSELPHDGIKEFLISLYEEIDLIQTRDYKGYEIMHGSECKEKVLELIKNKIDNIRED